MKNPRSIFIIVIFSIFVGLLHFIIGPDYQGPFRDFMRGYLIDIVLPMNMYLLAQVSLRRILPTYWCRINGAASVFLFGVTIEIMQKFGIRALGSTYDPLDFFMYGLGVILGVLVDLTLIDKLEKNIKQDK